MSKSFSISTCLSLNRGTLYNLFYYFISEAKARIDSPSNKEVHVKQRSQVIESFLCNNNECKTKCNRYTG